MHVRVRRADDVVLVDLSGELVLGEGDETLRQVVDELVAEGWKKILLNLSHVDRLDSAGVGELVSGWKLAQKFGGSLRLLRLGDRARHTLHLSQILPLLKVYEEEAEALADFAAT
jgi:anti-sigma B factor antagonist